MEDEIVVLDSISHVLLRPTMYIGDVSLDYIARPVLEGDRVVDRSMVYNAGMERLFLEVLVNASDNVVRSRDAGIDPGSIYVVVKGGTMRVRNEGKPFSCAMHSSGKPIPVVALGSMMSSSNFRDRGAVGGCNGVGGACTNIFSTLFNLEIGNGTEKKKMKIKWKNNMTLEKIEEEEYDGPSYTQVTYILDFARFYDDDISFDMAAKREYTDDMIASFAKHCCDTSFTAQVPVYFNGKKIECMDPLSYASLYWDMEGRKFMEWETKESRCIIVDGPFRAISFVNGVINEQGGIHLSTWRKEIYKPILKKLKKLGVKPSTLDKTISIILTCRLNNVVYVHQTKDKVKSPAPIIDVNVETEKACEWECVKKMVEKLKLMASSLSNITTKNNGKKCKTVKVNDLKDATMAGGARSHECTLHLCEGQSAYNYLIKKIDGVTEGALPLQGKFLNVSKCKREAYENSDMIKNINKVLGLKEEVDYSGDEYFKLRYGKVCCVFDADVDGQHIIGLWYNFIRTRHPSLAERNPPFICVMQTPLIRAVSGKRKYIFYSGSEYREWCEKNPNINHNATYYKGLASNSDSEVKESYERRRIVDYRWDDEVEGNMAMAFDRGFEDERKDWLLSWDPKIGRSTLASQYHANTFSHFIYHELCEFSYENVQRTMPSLIDGLKNCQRKIMTVVMSMKNSIKVSQLMGRVSDLMQYKHSEMSLYHAIVNLGDYYVGSNNIPLIQADGQYHSRQGGKAGSERYIKASASKVLPLIFKKEDTILLRHREDEGHKIEPYHYFPIIPLFAINGSDGIGSGFAMSIPAHSPADIIRYILWWLNNKENKTSATPPELRPFYFNYRGKIFKKENGWYSQGACHIVESRKNIKDIVITELPVNHTIKSYLKKLDKIIAESGQKVEYQDSASSYDYMYKGELRTEVQPNITIYGMVTSEDMIHDLGLEEKIPIPSIVLLDHNSIPRVYGHDLYTALSDYCVYRHKAYEKRRMLLLKMWKEKVAHLILKQKYIRDVIDGVISFKERGKPKSKATLTHEVTSLGYPASFLEFSVLSLTQDTIDSIDRDLAKFQVKIDKYENSTPASLWKEELKELLSYLK